MCTVHILHTVYSHSWYRVYILVAGCDLGYVECGLSGVCTVVYWYSIVNYEWDSKDIGDGGTVLQL